MSRMIRSFLACVCFLPAIAAAQATKISVRSAFFALEVDRKADDRYITPKDPTHRPIFVELGPSVAKHASLKERGRLFMITRYAGFVAIRPQLVRETRPATLIVEHSLPCRLRLVARVVTVSDSEPPQDALRADGCAEPGNRYGGFVVLGRFDEARWIKKANVETVRPLVLQTLPKGVSPDSPMAKTGIPLINRQRLADHEADLRESRRRTEADIVATRARGGMRDDDTRLQPFLAAAKADKRPRDARADLFIAADRVYVHFSDQKVHSFLMSFDAQGSPRLELQ